MERCTSCKVKMKPIKYDGEEYHYCPKCKWYFGCFFQSTQHPKDAIAEMDEKYPEDAATLISELKKAGYKWEEL